MMHRSLATHTHRRGPVADDDKPPSMPFYYQSGGTAADAAGATLSSPYVYPPHHRHGTNTPTADEFAVEKEEEHRPLTFWPLLALIFYSSSGGPFGIEPIVGAVGPLLGILGYLFFPLVWSVPEALMTAELSSAMPECAGSVAWVTEAFGPTTGYMRGCLSWLSGVIDNAIYPVLFADYLASVDSRLAGPAPRALLITSFTLTFSYLAWRGLEVAGKLVIGICIACCFLPFAVLCLVGAFHLDLSRAKTWTDDPGDLTKDQWRAYLGILFWNLNAFDSAASFAGEVRDPGRTYPRAMLASIAIIVASYVLPILVGALAAATDIPYDSWTDGTFTEVARQVGGEWLAGWIVAAAAVSTVGLYLAEMSGDAFQMMGMAELGMLPSVLGRKSRHDTPTHAIVLATAAIVVMSLVSSFQEIVSTTNALYSLAILLEIAAFLLLRLERPDMPRPYRMPVNTLGAHLVMVLPVAFIFIVLATATLKTWLVSGGLAIAGVVSYWAMDWLKTRGLCDFYVSTPVVVPLMVIGPSTREGEAEGTMVPVQDEDSEGEGGDGDEESLCPCPPHQHLQPRPPAAVTLAVRVTRSMSPGM